MIKQRWRKRLPGGLLAGRCHDLADGEGPGLFLDALFRLDGAESGSIDVSILS